MIFFKGIKRLAQISFNFIWNKKNIFNIYIDYHTFVQNIQQKIMNIDICTQTTLL